MKTIGYNEAARVPKSPELSLPSRPLIPPEGACLGLGSYTLMAEQACKGTPLHKAGLLAKVI